LQYLRALQNLSRRPTGRATYTTSSPTRVVSSRYSHASSHPTLFTSTYPLSHLFLGIRRSGRRIAVVIEKRAALLLVQRMNGVPGRISLQDIQAMSYPSRSHPMEANWRQLRETRLFVFGMPRVDHPLALRLQDTQTGFGLLRSRRTDADLHRRQTTTQFASGTPLPDLLSVVRWWDIGTVSALSHSRPPDVSWHQHLMTTPFVAGIRPVELPSASHSVDTQAVSIVFRSLRTELD
jgi:hypothetical protein